MVDLVSGDLQMLCTSPAQVMAALREGKIKALAVTGKNRMSHLPDVATVGEAGVDGYEVNAWVGLMAPAGVPQDILQKLNKEIASILAMPEVKERLAADGSEIVASSLEDFNEHIRSELNKWGMVIRTAGIKLQ
jgi:tripartite-type tricarboxylate transporter receptor subunit TctC